MIQEEAVELIVSVAPVEPDGSVYFQAPSGKSLYFQLLDEHYRALQTMCGSHGRCRRTAGLRGLPRDAQCRPADEARPGYSTRRTSRSCGLAAPLCGSIRIALT